MVTMVSMEDRPSMVEGARETARFSTILSPTLGSCSETEKASVGFLETLCGVSQSGGLHDFDAPYGELMAML